MLWVETAKKQMNISDITALEKVIKAFSSGKVSGDHGMWLSESNTAPIAKTQWPNVVDMNYQ